MSLTALSQIAIFLIFLPISIVVTSDDDQSSRSFTFTNFKDWTRRKAKSAFTRKLLYKRLPILRWLPQYNADDAVGDLVAGITVGLTVIPQALAYAGIAGLQPEVSLMLPSSSFSFWSPLFSFLLYSVSSK